MAPRKPAVTAEPAKKRTANEGSKVTKRPARGYRKYKNGLLNVTPKGDAEEKIVKQNQNSPLLRLPPEVRNLIWSYTLGYAVFRAFVNWNHNRRHELTSERRIGVALLRTCRQIYAEAALMPLQLNTFAFNSFPKGHGLVKRLQAYQRQRINSIRISLEYSVLYGILAPKTPSGEAGNELAQLFPALRVIEIRIYNTASQTDGSDSAFMAALKARIRRDFAVLVQEGSVELKVRGLAKGSRWHDRYYM